VVKAAAGSSPWQGAANPFPAAAVAIVSDLRPETVTIPTAAVGEVYELVDSYLQATSVVGGGVGGHGERLVGTGKICVIEGDYGTGKTQLAIEVLDRMSRANDDGRVTGRIFYDVAPGGTFHTFYADLMNRAIGKDDVLARVREFYADVVADSLRDMPYTDALVTDLELGRRDPLRVVDRYGLKEGALQEALRHRLTSVTSDPTFSRGLALLLEPDLGDLVWTWFSGGSLSQVLIEWGVEHPISTDVLAMDALGVVALLYGRRNRRFVLVIDEMEKLALDWGRSESSKAQAFKRLLEVFRTAGACLVVCGLSDVFTVLPRDHGRIDKTIHPSPLSEQDVRWYIAESQQRLERGRTLTPFTEESIRYLIYLTDGNAREVVRLCYEAYQEASATGREVTPSLLNKIARGQSSYGGAEAVRRIVEDLLVTYIGRPATARRVLTLPLGTVVADFWIPVGGNGAGCALLLSESVLEQARAEELRDKLRSIVTEIPDSAAILVVAGYLPANLRQVIAEAVADDEMLVYNAHTFTKDFNQLVTAAIDRIDPSPVQPRGGAAESEDLRALRTETESLRNQQAAVLRSVRELAGRTEDRLNSLHKAVQALPGTLARTGGTPEAPLPSGIESLFSDAEQRLDAYGSVRAFVDEAFEIAADSPGARLMMAHRLRQAEAFSPIGVAAFLSDLLSSFRESVRDWLDRVSGQDTGQQRPTASAKALLQGICGTYDALYAATPLYRLDPLADLVEGAAGDEASLARPSKAARREAVVDAFEGLGSRVFAAALAAAGG
jgi:hypothetical protein